MRTRDLLTSLVLSAALAVPLAAPAALAGAGRHAGPFALRTDARAYQAVSRPGGVDWSGYEVRVVARFRNASRRTVYLARCRPESAHPLYDVQPVDTRVRASRYAVICAGVGHNRQFAVRPGAGRTDTLTLAWPGEADGATHRPWGTPEGRFRLVYFVQDSSGDRAFGEGPVRSSAFTVRAVP